MSAQGRSRAIHRRSAGSAVRTRPACSRPEEAEGHPGGVAVVHDRGVEPDHRDGVGAERHEHDEARPRRRRPVRAGAPCPRAGRPARRTRAGARSTTRGRSWRTRPTTARSSGSRGRRPRRAAARRRRSPSRTAPTATGWPAPARRRRRTPRGTRWGPGPPARRCAGRRGRPRRRRPPRGAPPRRAATGPPGVRRRRSRARSHCGHVVLRSRARRQDTAFAYPPTRKKTGITWKTQVSGWVQGARSSSAPVTRSAVADGDRGDEPVAEHHDAERPDAEQVDDAVARGGRGGRDGAGAASLHAPSVVPAGSSRPEHSYPVGPHPDAAHLGQAERPSGRDGGVTPATPIPHIPRTSGDARIPRRGRPISSVRRTGTH